MRATVLIVTISFLLQACGPGHAEQASEADHDTRTYIAKTCAGCHPGPKLETMVRRRLERTPSPSLAEFLATHHVPDRAQREIVSEYLQRIVARTPETPAP